MLNKINIKLNQMLKKLLNEKSNFKNMLLNESVIKENHKIKQLQNLDSFKNNENNKVKKLNDEKHTNIKVNIESFKDLEEIFDKFFEEMTKKNIEFLNLFFNNSEIKKVTYDKKKSRNNKLDKNKEFLFFLLIDFFNIPSKLFINLKEEKIIIFILLKEKINEQYKKVEDFKKELFEKLKKYEIKDLIVNVFDKKEIFYNNIVKFFFNRKINIDA